MPNPDPVQAVQAAPATLASVLEGLLAGHRYAEALDLLRAAEKERPESRAIRDGIALLERRIGRSVDAELGDLSRVPRLTLGGEALARLSPADLGVAVKVDGVSSLRNLLDRAGAGRRALATRLGALIARGVVSVEPDRPATVVVEEPTRPLRILLPRPEDCERTAQIALVPDAQAFMKRARRDQRRQLVRGYLVGGATIAVGVASVAAAARYHDVIWSAIAALLTQ